MIEALIHGIHALSRLHAAKFLTPPRHKISISPRLAMAFDQKSMLMIQQDPGEQIIAPNPKLFRRRTTQPWKKRFRQLSFHIRRRELKQAGQ